MNSLQDVLDFLCMLDDAELRELRDAINDRLSACPTDPAPPPDLVPRNFEEN